MERLVRKNLQQVVLSSQSNDKSTNHPQLKLIWGTTMYHLDDIPFDHSSLPDVYTHFRKASFVVTDIMCMDKQENAFSVDETLFCSLLKLSAQSEAALEFLHLLDLHLALSIGVPFL